MLVRVGGVPQLRRAIEDHRIDGQQVRLTSTFSLATHSLIQI